MQAVINHHTSPRFWDCYYRLPTAVQKLADSNFELLKSNPRHPSLHFKQTAQFWSVRIGIRYRAIGVSVPDGIVWFWIGTHSDYDRMVN